MLYCAKTRFPAHDQQFFQLEYDKIGIDALHSVNHEYPLIIRIFREAPALIF